MEQEGTDGTVRAQQHPERVLVMQDYFGFWKVHLGPHLIGNETRHRGRDSVIERKKERSILFVFQSRSGVQ